MIRIKSENAVITRADTRTGVNGDNVNLNGRVLEPENADRGYKGAGLLNGEFVLGVSSGDVASRSATVSMRALSSRIPSIRASHDDYAGEIDGYFDDAYREISMKNGAADNVDSMVLYVYGDKLVAANMGKSLLYQYNTLKLEPVTFNNDESIEFGQISYRTLTIKTRCEFIIMTDSVLDYLTQEDVVDIMRTSETVKKAAQRLVSKAVENGCEEDLTILVTQLTPIEISDNPLPVGAAAGVDEVTVKSEVEGSDDYLEDDKEVKTGAGKKAIAVLLTAAIISLILWGTYMFVSGKWTLGGKRESESTAAVLTAYTTVAPATVATTEPGTTEEGTTEPGTTEAPTTVTTTATTTARSTTAASTTAARVTTTRAPVTETEAPSTTATRPTEPTSSQTTTEAPTSVTEPTSSTTERPTDAPTDPPTVPTTVDNGDEPLG